MIPYTKPEHPNVYISPFICPHKLKHAYTHESGKRTKEGGGGGAREGRKGEEEEEEGEEEEEHMSILTVVCGSWNSEFRFSCATGNQPQSHLPSLEMCSFAPFHLFLNKYAIGPSQTQIIL